MYEKQVDTVQLKGIVVLVVLNWDLGFDRIWIEKLLMCTEVNNSERIIEQSFQVENSP